MRVVFLNLLFFTAAIVASEALDTPSSDASLGKTHFIVGAPTQTVPLPKEPHKQAVTMQAPLSAKSKKARTCALFAPNDDLRAELLNYITNASGRIYIAVYMITDRQIANALLAAKKRGVDIEIVVDVNCLKDKSSKIPLLAAHGAVIYLFNPTAEYGMKNGSLMHHKFALFSNVKGMHVVWTGSYNFTRAASEMNQENVLVIKKKKIFDQYLNQFDRLKSKSLRYTGRTVIV